MVFFCPRRLEEAIDVVSRNGLRTLRTALAFLTTLPLPPLREARADDLRLAVPAFPLAGAAIGLLLLALHALIAPLPDLLRGALLLAAWLLLTGALHIDGLCDTADAAFASRSPRERREILSDPRVGSFGLAAGATHLLVKGAALAALTMPLWLVAIPALARSAAAVTMAALPSHASSRLGRSARPGAVAASQAALIGVVVAVGTGLGGVDWLVALTVAALTATLLATWLVRRLDGLGGDAYGAIIETTEAALLIAAVWP
jgi:adenosylcobinamide-GDP ribazoletransferase